MGAATTDNVKVAVMSNGSGGSSPAIRRAKGPALGHGRAHKAAEVRAVPRRERARPWAPYARAHAHVARAEAQTVLVAPA